MTFHDFQKLIKRNRFEDLEHALNVGVDIDLSNVNGFTLLMLAAKTGNTVIGELLIERGANLNARTAFSQSNFQQTPLSVAAMSGKTSFVELLLSKGASLDASPYPGSFESYIDWLEKYSAVTSEQAANIRSVIVAERDKRVV